MLITDLSPHLFWDTNQVACDWERNAPFIIERVLCRGRYEDWLLIREVYGIPRLKTEVIKLRYLDKKALHFCSAYFDIPLTEFRCYKPNPSIQALWNF